MSAKLQAITAGDGETGMPLPGRPRRRHKRKLGRDSKGKSKKFPKIILITKYILISFFNFSLIR